MLARNIAVCVLHVERIRSREQLSGKEPSFVSVLTGHLSVILSKDFIGRDLFVAVFRLRVGRPPDASKHDETDELREHRFRELASKNLHRFLRLTMRVIVRDSVFGRGLDADEIVDSLRAQFDAPLGLEDDFRGIGDVVQFQCFLSLIEPSFSVSETSFSSIDGVLGDWHTVCKIALL